MFCDACRSRLNGLVHDAEARPGPVYGFPSTLVWPDELPDGSPLLRCPSSECRRGFRHLLEVRTARWTLGAVPEELGTVWRAALAEIPAWPGFLRLELTDGERRALASVVRGTSEFYEALLRRADRVFLGGNDEELEVSFRWDLTGDEDEGRESSSGDDSADTGVDAPERSRAGLNGPSGGGAERFD